MRQSTLKLGWEGRTNVNSSFNAATSTIVFWNVRVEDHVILKMKKAELLTDVSVIRNSDCASYR